MRRIWRRVEHATSPILPRVQSKRQALRAEYLVDMPGRGHMHTLRDSSSVKSEEDHTRYCTGGYHPVHLDEIFNDRYKIISKLGYGRYSTVWLVQDLNSQTAQYVALKVLTADSHGTLKQTYELDILRHIKAVRSDDPGYKRIVHLQDSFLHKGPNGTHLCLVLGLMGQDVCSMIKNLPKSQLAIGTVRRLSVQMLQALDWLHRCCSIIHTDVKPANILIELSDVQAAVHEHLARLQQSEIDIDIARLHSHPVLDNAISNPHDLDFKLGDFGVSSWHDKHLSEWIQPPSLRAPEVFLGAPWGYGVDVWSLACVIYELIQGRVLFKGRPGPKDAWTAEEDQLAQMIELLGPMPLSFLMKGKLWNQYFDQNGDLLHIKQLYPISLGQLLAQTKNITMSAEDYQTFEAFLRASLNYEEPGRKSAEELLHASWLPQELPTDTGT